MGRANRWNEIKGGARRLAELGRDRLRRTAERLGGEGRPPPARPQASGAAAAVAPVPDHQALKVTGIVLAAVTLLIVLIILIWDWNWFRQPLATWASQQTGRRVRIDGDLKVKLLTWTPELSVGGLKIGDPSWAGAGDTARVRTLRLKVKALPLLVGQVEVPSVALDRPEFKLVRAKDGRANWRFGHDQGDHPTRLPAIQELRVADGKLDFTDQKRGLRLIGTVQSREQLTGQGGGAFGLIGDGTLNRRPFKLTITGGPLIQVRKDRPYKFVADVRMAATHLSAEGQIDRPFDFGHYRARLKASGPDMADLYYLTGLTFPNTPDYAASGQFSRDGSVYRYQKFAGRVGRSDLAGDLTVSKHGDRPFLEADLHSRALDFADLTATVGGGKPMSATGGGMPDAELDVRRLRLMDAKVSYRATAVKANALNLRAVKLGLKLDRGLLVADPIAFGFGRGQLTGTARLNAREKVPVTDVDLKLTGYRFENLLPARFSGALSGAMEGHFVLHGTGASARAAAASSSGRIRLVSSGGEVRQAFAELLGINVGRGLYLLLNKDPRRTPLRCAVADFDVRGGVARVNRFVIDTGVVTSRGEGSIDLTRQTLNLRLKGDSKKPRLLRLWAPITITGPLGKPHVGIEGQAVAAQAGIGGALGALVSPLAAVIPFIDPGGKDVNCQALLAGR